MEVIPIEIFGIAVDVPFESPRTFQQSRIESLAPRFCDQKAGLNLRPDQVRLRRSDELFDYKLTGKFFGDNGQLTIAADRAKLHIRNARTMGDWGIIQQTYTRFYQIMEFAPTTVTNLSTHVHAKFSSTYERDDFLKQFAFSPGIGRPAALGYVHIPDWEKEIRVLMEKSNAISDGLFVVWDTQFVNHQDWDTFLSTLPTLMENSANLFELAFDPLK